MQHSAGLKRRTDFFEVNVTPKAKKSRDSDPPTFLTLAPFAVIPKVCFSNVKLNCTTTHVVYLRNPSDLLIEIQLEVNVEALQIGLEFSTLYFSIPPSSTETLEIKWTPKIAVQWRGKIQIKHLNGNNKFSYISLACASVSPTPKKGVKKKPALSKKDPLIRTPGRKKPEKLSFAASGRIPPCIAVTPIRRETYEVVKPTFFPAGAPNTKVNSHQALSISHATVDEDLESTFSSSRIISSSPASKMNNEANKCQLREPLKEYNFNTRPGTSFKKEDSPVFRKKVLERKLSTSFEINTSFERDSLDSPIVWNRSRSPVFKSSSFYLTDKNSPTKRREINGSTNGKPFQYATSKIETNSPKKEKSFYLDRSVSPDFNLSSDLSLHNTSFSFWSQVSINEKVTHHVKFESIDTRKPFKEEIYKDDLSKCTFSSLNDSISPTRKASSVNLDTTFQVSSTTVTPKKLNETKFLTISSAKQPVSFDISPARPVFRKSVSDFTHRRLIKKERNTQEEFEKLRQAVDDCDNAVFTHESDKKSLYDEPDYLLHPYGITTISNPFSRHAVHPREWLEKLELELIKWLNSLLTPPIEMGSIVEGVDVKKLWDKSTASDLKIAPSRDAAYKDYVLSDGSRLTTLRKAAASLGRSECVRETIHNIRGKISTGFLSVKDDISLFHNQGARVKLVQMCMYYNPLWLRIGLEVIYEQVIPLHENNIHRGLVYFLKNFFLSDQEIISKHKYTKSNHPLGSAFMLEMNNFIVLKFLILIYFLDLAKRKKIIPYDPCLFCKNSPIKESEGMLNEFIKEFLKCVGQFKKTLKHLGYNLQYRQTFLDEFDYGLSSHLDLRDGVRLTRVMEIILKDPSYSSKLWTPAFSRIQKIHNVQTALSALQSSGYHISSEITPTDIVSGHREKIFSLLWQILHDFLAPRYQTAAKNLQSWWRQKYLKVYINKRILMRKKIVVIQALVRGFLARRRIKKKHSAAVQIQRWYRQQSQCFSYRRDFLYKKKAAIKIQKWYRFILLMRAERKLFLQQKNAALVIQAYFRNYCITKSCRNDFLRIKKAVVLIQRWFRNYLLYKKERQEFLLKRKAAIAMQRKFRDIMKRKLLRKEFLDKRNAAIKIQRFYRSLVAARLARAQYLEKTAAIVTIQRWYRTKTVTEERKIFLLTKKSVIKIQRWYRNMKIFRRLKEMQKFISAVVRIQAFYRAYRVRKELKPILAKLPKETSQPKSSSEGLVLSDVFKKAIPMLNCQYRQKCRNLGDVALAYKDIDVCTLFSPVLCLELSNYKFFYEALWSDLDQGLRSGPHLDIFRHGLNIIIKLIKFPQTCDKLLEKMDMYDGYGVIVRLMGKFFEKNTDIYCKAATIIWLLLTTFENAKERLDVDKIIFIHKKIKSKNTPAPKKKFLPPKTVDWGYFNKPVEFLNVKTASDELFALLS